MHQMQLIQLTRRLSIAVVMLCEHWTWTWQIVLHPPPINHRLGHDRIATVNHESLLKLCPVNQNRFVCYILDGCHSLETQLSTPAHVYASRIGLRGHIAHHTEYTYTHTNAPNAPHTHSYTIPYIIHARKCTNCLICAAHHQNRFVRHYSSYDWNVTQKQQQSTAAAAATSSRNVINTAGICSLLISWCVAFDS